MSGTLELRGMFTTAASRDIFVYQSAGEAPIVARSGNNQSHRPHVDYKELSDSILRMRTEAAGDIDDENHLSAHRSDLSLPGDWFLATRRKRPLSSSAIGVAMRAVERSVIRLPEITVSPQRMSGDYSVREVVGALLVPMLIDPSLPPEAQSGRLEITNYNPFPDELGFMGEIGLKHIQDTPVYAGDVQHAIAMLGWA